MEASSAPGAQARGGQTARQIGLALLVLVALTALFAPLFIDRSDPRAPAVVNGRLSFDAYKLGSRPVNLAGEWRVTWNAGEGDKGPAPGAQTLARVPGAWTGLPTDGGRRLPKSGFATYQLELSGLTPNVGHLLYVSTICSASQVWIDGRLASNSGVVGPDAASTVLDWRPQEVTVFPKTDRVQVRIDIASFHHTCNGMQTPPVFGLEEPTRNWAKSKIAQDFLFHATLLLLTVYAVVIFIFRTSDRASLYFGLSLVLLMPASALLGRENLVLLAAPNIDFTTMMAITYLSGIGGVSLFLAYAHSLFPRDSVRAIVYLIQIALGAALLFNLALFIRGETLIASRWYGWIGIGMVAALFYVVTIVAAATLRGREGAAVFLFGVVALVASIGVGVYGASQGNLSADKFFGVKTMPVGILVLLFAQVIILAERWSSAIRNAEGLAGDMRRLLEVSASITTEVRVESLLSKIVAATSAFLSADRSSLFLFDQKRNLLWSLVAQGMGKREIQLAPNEGVAGQAFSSGATLNVADAYRHPQFNREVDEATGYRTRSILAMPITARDGRKLGVMQALNRAGAEGFDAADIQRMSAFAAQAAIAIDNATLFTEMAEARTYNESILSSMKNGVITLDEDGKLVKLNAAALEIMEAASEEALLGRHYTGVLVGPNAWFAEEIANVEQDGRARTFLDVDFHTAQGRAIDMNVQIVPLVVGGQRNGLLVLIEDIRSEKRLEGAMRRFMTPKVVDQVLKNQDDLLFGASCRASVLFADIRNFTTIAEKLAARETVNMLNEVFTELVEAVSSHDGVLDKFMGDAVMAVFGAPIASGRDRENAVDCAVAMMGALTQINLKRRARGQSDLRLGIGVATGDVVAGTIGSPKRMDYTVIGDSVNLASRLQNASKHYQAGVILCSQTAQAVDPAVLRPIDLIRVRGREKPEAIFQALAYHTEESFPNMAAVLAAYREGYSAMQARDWARAVAAFEAARAANPSDRPSEIHLERARAFLAAPPPADWDGAWAAPD